MDLSNLSSSLQGLSYDPLFNFGTGLMAASGPSLMPHSLGQGLAQAAQYSSQAQERAAQARMLQLQAARFGMQNQAIAGVLGGQGGSPVNQPSTDAGAAPMLASANGTPGQSFAATQQGGLPLGGGAGGMTQDPMFKLGFAFDPAAGSKQYLDRAYPQPTDFQKLLEASGIDPQSQIGRQLIQQQIAKLNYQAPTSLRPGGWMLDPVSGRLTNLPQASAGFQVVQGPNGQFQEVPVAGGQEAVAASEAAKAGGRAQYSLQKVWNPETGQYELQSTANVANQANGTAPMRNNNPGALSPGGQIANYPDMQTGLQALDKNLKSYGDQGISTIQDAITKWAPPKDKNGKVINDTAAYIKDVTGRLGIQPDQPIDLNNPAQRQALSTAIMLHENGPSGVFGHAQEKGAMAAEPSLGSPQAAVTSKTAVPESMQKDFEAMQSQSPQAQQSIDALDKMIGLAKNKPWYLGGPAGVIPGVDRVSPDAAEYEKQRANVIALQGKALGSGGTDAARANIAESIPDYGKPQKAMLDGLQTQRNQVVVGQLRKQFLTPAYNAADANKYTEMSNGFDQHIKPQMAPVFQLTGKEQAAAVAAAIKANPSLKPNFKWAFDNGLLQ